MEARMISLTRLNEQEHGTCPVCHAERDSVTQDSKHCNGEWNERIRYKCGCVVHYSPNFMQVETEAQCPRSPGEEAKRKSIASYFQAVLEVAERTECLNKAFKIKIVESIQSHAWQARLSGL